MKEAPEILDRITDVVLAYRPKSKTKKARRYKKSENRSVPNGNKKSFR